VSEFPVPDRAAANELGAALRDVGYSDTALETLLGEGAYTIERDQAPIDARRLPDSPVGMAIRLLFLQLSVPRTSALQELGDRLVGALEATGLARVDSQVDPRARILPVGSTLLASDGYSLDGDDPSDYVATYTPTARVLDSLTPRPHVERALDVGTGSGIHALLAAQHADHVIATDVNPRALAYTQLNAALNGLANVECRQGSLFEPVEGERFDLITCNAPYVVSPERRWAYRDSGFEEDEVSARVVRAASEHLKLGGYAAMLVSWLAEDEDAPDERVRAWVEATACSGWILPSQGADVLDHAAEWNSHLAGDPEAFARAVDEWAEYFGRLGVRWISEGAVLLHRARGERSIRIDPIDEEDLDEAGDQVQRAFAGRARLLELDTWGPLLESRVEVAMPFRLEREVEPRGARAVDTEGRVELADGIKLAADASADAQEAIASLDGKLTLRRVIETTGDRLALSEEEFDEWEDEVVDLVILLIELGALQVKG
jgi:methylase of polypeptide subunit release factors